MTAPMKDQSAGRVRRFFKWLNRQMDVRPFFSALAVLMLIVIPGFLRMEQIAGDAKDAATSAQITSEALKNKEARDDILEQRRNLVSCQTRNTFQQNTRTKFERFNDVVELAFLSTPTTDPERAERTRKFIADLRASVETLPKDEDRDCNGDKKFDFNDYLP